jgi:hypothetical protein
MALRPLQPLHVARSQTAHGEEPAESSTRIKRSPQHSEDSEAAILASLDAALAELDHLEIEAPRARVTTRLPVRILPKGMPPLPAARAFPRNMPPLPTSARLPPPLPVALEPAAPVASVSAPAPAPRRSRKPLALALVLLGACSGTLYVVSARTHLSLTQLGAAAAHMVRP